MKKLINQLTPDIQTLVGSESRVMVACRKGLSVGNRVVRNRQLSSEDVTCGETQKCGRAKCRSCETMLAEEEAMIVNNKELRLSTALNCGSNNVIYAAQCKHCPETDRNTYCGQTMQKCRERMNGHRDACRHEAKADKSALSLHMVISHPEIHKRMCHPDNKRNPLEHYRIAVVKKVPPERLDREEFSFIEEYRCDTLGLNRINVIRK